MTLVSDKDWRDIVDLYFQVKDLVATAEIVDTDQRLCLSAITELRSALDHLMRIQHVAVVEGQARPLLAATDDDPRPKIPARDEARTVYCASNLQKAKGHLYRAAYDSLDALILSDLSEFETLTSRFDFDDICEALPDFPESRARIDQARACVVRSKMSKDVEPAAALDSSVEVPQENGSVIEQYLLAHRAITEVCCQVRQNCLRIRAAVRRRKRAFFMPILIGVFSSLAAAILIAVGVWLAQFLPAPRREGKPSNVPRGAAALSTAPVSHEPRVLSIRPANE